MQSELQKELQRAPQNITLKTFIRAGPNSLGAAWIKDLMNLEFIFACVMGADVTLVLVIRALWF